MPQSTDFPKSVEYESHNRTNCVTLRVECCMLFMTKSLSFSLSLSDISYFGTRQSKALRLIILNVMTVGGATISQIAASEKQKICVIAKYRRSCTNFVWQNDKVSYVWQNLSLSLSHFLLWNSAEQGIQAYNIKGPWQLVGLIFHNAPLLLRCYYGPKLMYQLQNELSPSSFRKILIPIMLSLCFIRFTL